MRFVVDASSDIRLVANLESLGRDATFVGSDYPGEFSDFDIAIIARDDDRIVITNDRRFGDLAIRHAVRVPGIIFFRIPGRDFATRIACLMAVFAEFPNPTGFLVTATPDRIGARRLGG